MRHGSYGNLKAALTAAALLLGSALQAAAQTCNGSPLTGGTQRCSSNASGALGGYTWTIWSSGSGGCITPRGVGAAYRATWNNSGDFLARMGLQWNETQTYNQYGIISADYAYTKTGTGGGYSFIGIYGWSNNPLIEYYIVDDWYGGTTPPTGGGTLRGTFNVDEGTYRVYTNTRVNAPSIHGTATFQQFFSVRQTARQCGRISITAHFDQWASLGMTLGRMYEAKLLVEAGGGSGSIDYTNGVVVANTTPVLFLPETRRGSFTLPGGKEALDVLGRWSNRPNGPAVRTLWSAVGRASVVIAESQTE